MPTIIDLERCVANLPAPERHYFERIFRVDSVVGITRPPRSMYEWIQRQFGEVRELLQQTVVKVTNLVTMEGALFNELRAQRPMEYRDRMALEAQLIDGARIDPFRNPWEETPEDPFGRIRGRYCLTGGNIAKYDGFHGVIVFDEPNPLRFTPEQVADYVDTGLFWMKKAHSVDPQACYPLFIWNCLWKAGASIQHGHAQVTLTRGLHYVKVEALRQAALAYRKEHGNSYFDDLYAVHAALGLGFERDDTRALVYLAPLKEKETIVIAPGPTPAFKAMLYDVLACLRDRVGTVSFNVAIYMPPLAATPEDWSGFPTIARVVDRGDPRARPSDMGSMELYAQSVVSSDPFKVAEALHRHLEVEEFGDEYILGGRQ